MGEGVLLRKIWLISGLIWASIFEIAFIDCGLNVYCEFSFPVFRMFWGTYAM